MLNAMLKWRVLSLDLKAEKQPQSRKKTGRLLHISGAQCLKLQEPITMADLTADKSMKLDEL